MRDSEPVLFSIGEVRERTGLTERRIRYYETLHLLAPRRSEGNQRLYSQHDIERLLEIKRLLESGLSLKAIRERLDDRTPEVEWDADAYFEGKRIAHGEAPRHRSLYPLRDRAQIIRRLTRDDETEEKH
ncbi:MAG: MerR family transcriptional regulator [Sulfobacillus sp.]|nr:MerR family transcriptional regulator [Sulfobacillus sp.]